MSISETLETFGNDSPELGAITDISDDGIIRQPFVEYADAWRSAGWVGVIPLPPKAKNPPPNCYTGNKPNRILYASESRVRAWIESGRYNEDTRNPQTVGNIGLALGWPVELAGERLQVVGVDVDDYESRGKAKHGGSQLKRLESQLGQLPATYISSARADGVSGIRFYLAPADAEFRGQADRDIEIIQRKHRYAVVWPSTHPDSGIYRLYPPGVAPDGVSFREEIPQVTELPRLPESWVSYLQDTNGAVGRPIDSESSPSELSDWATQTFNAGDHGSACAEIRRNVAYWRAEIAREATSHDKIRNAHWQIVKAAAEGHTGWHWALEEIKAVYVGDVTDRNKRGYSELHGELFRSLTNALRKTKAAPGSSRVNPQCVCALGTVPDFRTVGDATQGDSMDSETVTAYADPADAISSALADFWVSSEHLQWLRQHAQARCVSPTAMLGAALARVVSAIPPNVVLPPTVGSYASLNQSFALVGESGRTKSTSIAAMRDWLTVAPNYLPRKPGTTEGLRKCYAKQQTVDILDPSGQPTGKKRLEQIGSQWSVLAIVPEVDSLIAAKKRSASLMSELRSAWSGEDLAEDFADESKTIILRGNRYRFAMILGVQPGRARPLFDEADGGTPQRFIWLPTIDPDMPDVAPDLPAKLSLPRWPGMYQQNAVVDPDTALNKELANEADQDEFSVLDIPLSVQTQIRETIREINRGNAAVNPLDGHRNLVRLKLAAALMAMDFRYDAVTVDDWERAGAVMALSDATRQSVQELHKSEAVRENVQRGKMDGIRAAVAEDIKHSRDVTRVAGQIVKKLRNNDDTMPRSDLRKMFASRDRPYFDDAEQSLIETGQIKKSESENDGPSGHILTLIDGS